MRQPLHTLLTEQAARFSDLDSPRLSAEILLALCLNISRPELLKRLVLAPNSPAFASEDQKTTFQHLCARRMAGEPIAYILGHKEFLGLDFKVTPHTLIPRPETELLVETALTLAATRMKQRGAPFAYLRSFTFADLCTGSGCIAVAFALSMPLWEGIAIDICEHALAVARANALAHGADQLPFIQADIRQLVLPESTRSITSRAFVLRPESLDLLLSNPPYVSEQEYGETSPEVRLFEPKIALVPPAEAGADSDGFSLIAAVMRCAASALRPGGALVMELGHTQKERALAMLPPSLQRGAQVLPDLAGKDRVLVARKRLG